MKNKYRNWFTAFGILAIVLMLCLSDMSYDDIRESLARVGSWFLAILLLWVFIYGLNACSWFLIINDGSCPYVSFRKVYKLSISGFALNYTTPCGLMGGEPYRIMELAPLVGTNKASSSVILYVMMHIFSHIWFWLLSLFCYLFLYPPTSAPMRLLLAGIVAFCLIIIYLFVKGYCRGLVVGALHMVAKFPFAKHRVMRLLEEKGERLTQIDLQIALLHKQRKGVFYGSLGLELAARLMSCLEIYFILHAFSVSIAFVDCVLILAFSSLFSNLLFFSPMQLGTREGGLAIAMGGLHLANGLGVYTGLITRLRELFWIVVGIALIKMGHSLKSIKQKL